MQHSGAAFTGCRSHVVSAEMSSDAPLPRLMSGLFLLPVGFLFLPLSPERSSVGGTRGSRASVLFNDDTSYRPAAQLLPCQYELPPAFNRNHILHLTSAEGDDLLFGSKHPNKINKTTILLQYLLPNLGCVTAELTAFKLPLPI